MKREWARDSALIAACGVLAYAVLNFSVGNQEYLMSNVGLSIGIFLLIFFFVSSFLAYHLIDKSKK